MSNTIAAIDEKFNSRMTRTDIASTQNVRPVNPFAGRSSHNSASLEAERGMAPEVSALTKVGAVYGQGGVFGSIEKVVDTKEEQYIQLNKRNITHPDSGIRLHTTGKLPTDGTRVK